jgi:hypothetical protein
MAKSLEAQIAGLLKDLQKTARRLEGDVRKRVTKSGVVKRLDKAASDLDKHATRAGRQVQRYIDRIAKEIGRGAKGKRKRKTAKATKGRKRTPARRKSAARKRTTRSRARA